MFFYLIFLLFSSLEQRHLLDSRKWFLIFDNFSPPKYIDFPLGFENIFNTKFNLL